MNQIFQEPEDIYYLFSNLTKKNPNHIVDESFKKLIFGEGDIIAQYFQSLYYGICPYEGN
jgi:hypothetical protein